MRELAQYGAMTNMAISSIPNMAAKPQSTKKNAETFARKVKEMMED